MRPSRRWWRTVRRARSHRYSNGDRGRAVSAAARRPATTMAVPGRRAGLEPRQSAHRRASSSSTGVASADSGDFMVTRSPCVLEGRATTEQDLVQDHAELPDVRALIADRPQQGLRRHVVGRAAVDGGVGGHLDGESEVGEHQPAVRHAQHVLWRHVAVDDPDGVDGRQAGADGARVLEPLGERPLRRAAVLHQIAQRAARTQLHGDEPVAVGMPELEDPADVGMADRARDLHLAREALDPAALEGALGEQNLNGDRLPQDPIPGPIHRPAPPCPSVASI